ncbi:MAG: chemotaxis protein CheW [Roseovarius sp.]|nr:chemotaxis protein CheW [Roseovarius sp.]
MSEQTTAFEAVNQELVAFRVSEQDFCIDIMSVREIRGWTQATVLPHAPDYVKGVVNLRGAVVPVLDLSARLGLGTHEPGSRHVIIIVIINNQTVGLLADVVSDILSVSTKQFQPVPDIASEAAKVYIDGVIVNDDRMIRKINLQRLIPLSQELAA